MQRAISHTHYRRSSEFIRQVDCLQYRITFYTATKFAAQEESDAQELFSHQSCLFFSADPYAVDGRRLRADLHSQRQGIFIYR
jgi:hypothetical protein